MRHGGVAFIESLAYPPAVKIHALKYENLSLSKGIYCFFTFTAVYLAPDVCTDYFGVWRRKLVWAQQQAVR